MKLFLKKIMNVKEIYRIKFLNKVIQLIFKQN